MITNPFKRQDGAFTLPSEFSRRQGKRPFVFGMDLWSALTVWNAAETMKTQHFDLADLIGKCGHDNLDIRTVARREWCNRIARAAIVKESYNQFLAGEENYNGPKICENTRKTILKSDLTQIILDHRVKVQEWYDKKMQQKQEREMKPKAAEAVAAEAVAEAPPELVIEDNGDLDDWETLAD
jgi:hypothetical protein